MAVTMAAANRYLFIFILQCMRRECGTATLCSGGTQRDGLFPVFQEPAHSGRDSR